jgi:hypothetical protein
MAVQYRRPPRAGELAVLLAVYASLGLVERLFCLDSEKMLVGS